MKIALYQSQREIILSMQEKRQGPRSKVSSKGLSTEINILIIIHQHCFNGAPPQSRKKLKNQNQTPPTAQQAAADRDTWCSLFKAYSTSKLYEKRKTEFTI